MAAAGSSLSYFGGYFEYRLGITDSISLCPNIMLGSGFKRNETKPLGFIEPGVLLSVGLGNYRHLTMGVQYRLSKEEYKLQIIKSSITL